MFQTLFDLIYMLFIDSEAILYFKKNKHIRAIIYGVLLLCPILAIISAEQIIRESDDEEEAEEIKN